MDISKRTIWTIYCHTHVESGRRYIGLTKKTMMQRWNSHVLDAKSLHGKGCKHFWNAIRKYGKDAFSHEILAQSWSLEFANETEEYLVSFYETQNPKKGFNLSKGGGSQPHPIRKNPWNDPEYRKKCTENSRKLWRDPSVLSQASIRSKNKWNDPNYRSKYEEFWKDPQHKEKVLVGFNKHVKDQKSRTHCVNGHEFTPENTLLYDKRVCRICHLTRNKINKRLSRTHCPNGHEYSDNNTLLSKSRHRMCVICKSICPNGHELTPENLCKNDHKCRICVYDRNRKRRFYKKFLRQAA